MRAAKCVPVKRSGEHKTGTSGFVDNSELFSAVFAALAQGHRYLTTGNCITVFPEGTTHVDTQLKPLKTGTARMALEVARRDRSSPNATPTHSFASSQLALTT